MNMWSMKEEGNKIFNDMRDLLKKYEHMDKYFWLRAKWQIRGADKAAMLGGFIKDCRDTVDYAQNSLTR